MRRIERDKLLNAFPKDSCSIVSSADELRRTDNTGGRLVSILPLLLILLLLLMTAESFFANRFYRPGKEVQDMGAAETGDIFH